MEKSHLNRIRRKFPQALQGKRIITLGIPDEYEFMQPELLDELRGKLGPYVNHGDIGSNIGFADGHVEWVKRANYIYSYEMSQDDDRTTIGFDY